MGDVVPFGARTLTRHPFAGCPECGDTDGYLNLGADHWFRCDQHLTKWLVGSNLFSGWRDEAIADWSRNDRLLSQYRVVRPIERGRS